MLGPSGYRLDALLLVNVAFNLLFFWFAGSISWARLRWWRVVAASVVASGLTLLPLIVPWGGWFSGPVIAGISLVLVLFVAYPCSFSQFRAIFCGYWLMIGASGGTALSLLERFPDAGPMAMVLVAGGVAATMLGMTWVWQTYRERKVVRDAFCPFQVRLGEQRLTLTALVDSGNSLRTPVAGRPVAVVEADQLRTLVPPPVMEALAMGWDALEAVPARWRHRIQLIPYTAVGTQQAALLVIAPDGLAVWEKGRGRWVEVDGVIGLAMQPLHPQGHYQALLPPLMLQEAEAR